MIFASLKNICSKKNLQMHIFILENYHMLLFVYILVSFRFYMLSKKLLKKIFSHINRKYLGRKSNFILWIKNYKTCDEIFLVSFIMLKEKLWNITLLVMWVLQLLMIQ